MESNEEWQPAFSVGHPELDAEHRQMLALCNRASKCLADPAGHDFDEFHQILGDVMTHALQHFQTEERVLRQLNYDRLDEHLADHTAYLSRIVDYLTAASYGSTDMEGLQQCLAKWWMHHVLVTDRQFSFLFDPVKKLSPGADFEV